MDDDDKFSLRLKSDVDISPLFYSTFLSQEKTLLLFTTPILSGLITLPDNIRGKYNAEAQSAEAFYFPQMSTGEVINPYGKINIFRDFIP